MKYGQTKPDATIDEIRQALAAAQPGPWHWSGYKDSHNGPYLACWKPGLGRCIVMGFKRLGMRAAQPTFYDREHTQMFKGVDVAVREVDYRDDIIDMDHPDARLIVNAPHYIEVLLARIEQLEHEAMGGDL